MLFKGERMMMCGRKEARRKKTHADPSAYGYISCGCLRAPGGIGAAACASFRKLGYFIPQAQRPHDRCADPPGGIGELKCQRGLP